MGPIHPVWALAAIHPRWGNRYEILLNGARKVFSPANAGLADILDDAYFDFADVRVLFV